MFVGIADGSNVVGVVEGLFVGFAVGKMVGLDDGHSLEG
jgi:hypothetical protein